MLLVWLGWLSGNFSKLPITIYKLRPFNHLVYNVTILDIYQEGK